MARIVIGNRILEIPGVLGDRIDFPISPEALVVFDPNMLTRVLEIVKDIVIDAQPLIDVVKLPKVFHESAIRFDIIKGKDFNDEAIMRSYLKLERSYWEFRYKIEAFGWFCQFHSTIKAFNGRVGSQWFRLYEMVRGPIPVDFPKTVSFSVMIENVGSHRVSKYKRKVISEFFREHPEAIMQLLKNEIPPGIPIREEIGLNYELFLREAMRQAIVKRGV